MLTYELPAPTQRPRPATTRRIVATRPSQALDRRAELTPSAQAELVAAASASEHDVVVRWMPIAVPMAAVLLCASIGAVWAFVL